MMMVAVKDVVDGRDTEGARFHPQGPAKCITPVAHHEVGLKGSQYLGVLVEEVCFLFVRHLVPDGRMKARKEPVRDGIFGIGGTVLVDQHGLTFVLLDLFGKVWDAGGTRGIIKHTAAEGGGVNPAAGELLQQRIDLHGGAVTDVENGLRTGKKNAVRTFCGHDGLKRKTDKTGTGL